MEKRDVINSCHKNLIKYNQDRSDKIRKELKEKILSAIKENPSIGVNELQRRLGGSQSLIGTLFMQIRRNIKKEREADI